MTRPSPTGSRSRSSPSRICRHRSGCGIGRATGGPFRSHHHPCRARRRGELPPILQGFVPLRRSSATSTCRSTIAGYTCHVGATGELKQYDVTDPFHPRETASVRLGGIVRREPHRPFRTDRSAAARRWWRSAVTAARLCSPTRSTRPGTRFSTLTAWARGWRSSTPTSRMAGCRRRPVLPE